MKLALAVFVVVALAVPVGCGDDEPMEPDTGGSGTGTGPIQWAVADGGNGHWYGSIAVPVPWVDAKTHAESQEWMGVTGHLATIASEAENTFIWRNLASHRRWLGGFQDDGGEEPAGGWSWVTGEIWQYTNWNTVRGEPNNEGEDEQYLQFSPDIPLVGLWNDNSLCGEVSGCDIGYIIEWEPPAPLDGNVAPRNCHPSLAVADDCSRFGTFGERSMLRGSRSRSPDWSSRGGGDGARAWDRVVHDSPPSVARGWRLRRSGGRLRPTVDAGWAGW